MCVASPCPRSNRHSKSAALYAYTVYHCFVFLNSPDLTMLSYISYFIFYTFFLCLSFCVFFQIENKELRDLLVISKSSVKTAREETSQPEADVAATAAQEQSPQSGSTEWSEQLQSELWLRQQVLQDQGWRRRGWWSLCLCAPHYFFIKDGMQLNPQHIFCSEGHLNTTW